jgi:heptosyltransferase-2
VIQMLARGRPVVASAVGVQVDQVRPGVTGFLAHDRAEFVEGVVTLLRDRELRRRMGAAAREDVRARWSTAGVRRPGARMTDARRPSPDGANPPATGPAAVAPPKTLVVRLPNPAGDVVLSTLALRALRRALPTTRIVWAGKPEGLALVDGLADRDDVLPIEGPLARGFLAPMRLGRAWRALGADAVLLLKDSFSAGLAAGASKAAVRVGHAGRGRGSFLTHPIDPPTDARGRRLPEPMPLRFLRLAAVFGARGDGEGPHLVATAEGEARARARFTRAAVVGPYFVVSPGAAFGPSKVYPPALLGAAARQVRTETGRLPVVLCGPGEEDLARATLAAIGAPALATHDDVARWPETKAILAGARLLLTPDAGPRHVAAALGTPVVCVMGPTDPGWTRGDEATTTVVRNEALTCLGCHLRACPIGHPCMAGLDPADVARAAIARLARGTAP